jgi:hypothetical protein
MDSPLFQHGSHDLYDHLPQRRKGRKEKLMITKYKNLCALCAFAARIINALYL